MTEVAADLQEAIIDARETVKWLRGEVIVVGTNIAALRAACRSRANALEVVIQAVESLRDDPRDV